MKPAETKRPRILFLAHTAQLSGAELAVLRLVRVLDKERYDLSAMLFSDGPLAQQLAEAGASVHVMPLSESIVKTNRYDTATSFLRVKDVITTLKYVWRLARFIRSGKYDLVHTSSMKSDWIGGPAAVLARTPAIWHLHVRVACAYMPVALVILYRLTAYLFPSYMIANSQSTLDTLKPYPRRRCCVVYPGVMPPATPPAPRGTAARRAAAGQRVVGMVGRISPTKGQDIFLKAAARVLERFPDARFQIIGSVLFDDQEYERGIRELATSLKLDDAVEFIGFVHDVNARLAAMDVMVHGSTTPEPFGQVVVEAMMAARPVIATNAGGVPEIVEDRKSGLLVPPKDVEKMVAAICWILENPDEAEEMAWRGRERALARFTIEQTGRDVEMVYKQMLGV